MPTPLVLMYHGFGLRSADQDPDNLFVTAEALETQVSALLRRGGRPLDETSFLAGLHQARWPRRSFLVTMDDGYVSCLDVAAPILRRLGVPAVLFALPGLLGGTSRWMPRMPDEPLLDSAGLRELPRHGISVGLHGHDHSSLVGLTDHELQRQTVEARALLADTIGDEPALFAYPFGHHDAAAQRAVRDAGFRAAFAIYSRRTVFTFPRVDVNSLDTARTFRLKTLFLYPKTKAVLDRAPAVRRMAHAVAGRAVR